MKYEYRISKYDSKYRDADGVYTNNEWTSIGHVGKMFNNKVFTLPEYEYVESNYLSVIKEICLYENVSNLRIAELEDPFNVCRFRNGSLLNGIDEILEAAKACLREEYWCKLNGNGIFFHFGYDYYLYAHCSLNHEAIYNLVKEYGLFAEQMESPYKKFGDGSCLKSLSYFKSRLRNILYDRKKNR